MTDMLSRHMALRSLALSVAIGFAAASGAAAAPILSPASGAPDALPATQISVLGVRSSAIHRVRVVGSVSGVHAGRLRSYSGANGASFIPARPFAAGEHVAVTVTIAGRRPLRERFGVARPVPFSPVLGPPPGLKLDLAKLDHFATAPLLLAPRLTVLHAAPRGTPGELLITPLPAPVIHPGSRSKLSISVVGPSGPMIVDARGRLVWFDQLPSPEAAADLQEQTYGGRSVLTWWQGGVEPQAFGVGEGMIVDHSYRVIRTVRAGNGYQADIHELALIPGRRALLTAYQPMRITVRRHGAVRQVTVLNSVVQEIDVPTGLVMWEWDGLGHIPLTATYDVISADSDWDPFHLNSIQMLRRGKLLISARDTSAVYEVDQATGRIDWTLGGRRSSFRMGHGARFWLQHDARLASDGRRLSLFDDEAGPPARARSSRGLILDLDFHSHRATVAHSLRRARPTLANSEGSVQWEPGGGALVGFGATPYVTGFDARGRLDFDAALPAGDSTYRAFAANWHATPSTPPVAVAQRTAGQPIVVHVSWNGATDVTRWRVLAAGRTVASAVRQGFETTLRVPATSAPLSVRAVNARGRPFGPAATVAATTAP